MCREEDGIRAGDGFRGLVGSDKIGVEFDFFFQAEDGIRDIVRSRGLGDVYRRQRRGGADAKGRDAALGKKEPRTRARRGGADAKGSCLLFTSDAADELPRGDVGGYRRNKKKITACVVHTPHPNAHHYTQKTDKTHTTL